MALAFPGFNLKEELCPAKLKEMTALLKKEPLDAYTVSGPVYSRTDARRAGDELRRRDVDCILALITTFVPDYFIIELLSGCDKPVFLWAVEREMDCISLVCGPLITATLYNLGKHYSLSGADIADKDTLLKLGFFARASMACSLLSRARIGYMGGRPDIMFSMEVDEYRLKRSLGVSIVTIPIEKLYGTAENISDTDAEKSWEETRSRAGKIDVLPKDGIDSSKFLLAARRIVTRYGLDAISINCFPHLKSKICLAVARLNDSLIASGCEGDLHSTILMYLLTKITGRPAFNGDFLRLDKNKSSILFSHCGAGAFGLAPSPAEVGLRSSIETCDGLAVCYPTKMEGKVTLLNMMAGPGGLRISSMLGNAQKTDLSYEGTPLMVGFGHDVQKLLQRVSECGAGHHWNGTEGDLVEVFSLICKFLKIKFNDLTI